MRTYLLVMSRTVSAEVIRPSVDIIRHHEQPISKSLRILLIRSSGAPGPCTASLSHHNVLVIVLPSAICVSAHAWLRDTHSRMEILHFESAWGRAKPQESAEMPTCQMYNKFYICRIFTTILIPKRITTDNCKNSQIYKNVLIYKNENISKPIVQPPRNYVSPRVEFNTQQHTVKYICRW